jgi:DNA-binding beta-propeller fold protein YncE
MGPPGVVTDAAGGILVVDASNRVRRIAYGTITTLAGSGVAGHVSQGLPLPDDGGPALEAQLNNPIGVALDHDGNVLIADALYHRIRRVTPDGTITTIAGNGIPWFSGDGGPATAPSLQYPTGVALDHDGNVFIADAANQRIRRIDPDGTIATVAGTGGAGFAGDGGPATEAELHKPTGVAVSRKGELFIADEYNHRIRRVGPWENQHRRGCQRHPHVRRILARRLRRRRRAGHRGFPQLSHRGPIEHRVRRLARKQTRKRCDLLVEEQLHRLAGVLGPGGVGVGKR